MTEGIGVKLAADDSPPPGYTPPPMLAVYGDSFTTACPDHSRVEHAWPALVAADLQATLVSQGTGGSGYQTMQAGTTFPYSVVLGPAEQADVIVVFGGYNDNWLADFGAVRLQACVTFHLIRATNPGAVLIVAGPQYPATTPPPRWYWLRQAIQEAAAQADATFVDCLHWLQGRPDLICADGIHPNDAGHRFLADKLRPYVQQALTA